MRLAHVLVVLAKELRDALRDRRSLLSAMVFPLLGPVLMSAMFGMMVKQHRDDGPLELPVAGREHAPGLIAFLEQNGVEVVEPPADPEGAVRKGDVHAVLVISPDYAEKFRAGKPGPVELVVDASRNESRTPIRRARRVLDAYGAQLGAMRLLARGIDPSLSRPVAVEEVDLSTSAMMAATLLGTLPLFLVLGGFMGGMYVATDSTAGERERGSLEPLLLNPTSRAGLVAGKWLATCTLATFSVVLTLVTTLAALSRVPLEDIGFSVHMGVADAMLVLALVLPLCLLGAAAQLLVATFARSFREAQTYLSIMMLAPMLPEMFMTMNPIQPQPWMAAVPVLSQHVLVTGVLRGDAVAGWQVAVAAAVPIFFAFVALRVTAWLFSREKIVFGG